MRKTPLLPVLQTKVTKVVKPTHRQAEDEGWAKYNEYKAEQELELEFKGIKPPKAPPKAPLQKKPVKFNQKPYRSIYPNSKVKVRVAGPIKVKPGSTALGSDGIDYTVEWNSLDENGKVEQQWTNGPPKPSGGIIFAGNSLPEIHHPPFYSPNGFEVSINVPIQPNYSDNSIVTWVDVFASEGDDIQEVPTR